MGADLLSLVQPDSGWFAVVGIKKGGSIQQHLVQTREEVDALTQKFLEHEFDTYFGVAKYKDSSSRLRSNVKALKAFWLDLDCGEDKAAPNPRTGKVNGYIDQAAAFAALKAFVKENNLPRPTVVNSGRGVHVYWPLTEDVAPEVWEPIAHYFRDFCLNNDLIVDRAVFECARILRIPGTLNYKGEDPLPVELAYASDPISLDDFCAIIGYSTVLASNPVKRVSHLSSTVSEMMKGNLEFSFKRILTRPAGCAQINSIIMDREHLEEPRWFDALSVAAFCVDKEAAVRAVSEGHPDYDQDAAMRKTEHILGPHSCDMFERNNPGGCAGCPYKGTFKSPISLGRDLKEAEPEEIVIKTEDGEEEVFTFPTLPAAYMRMAKGGIAIRVAEGEEGDPQVVFPYDLYVRQRTTDTLTGDGSMVYFHSPKDGVRKFSMANTVIVDKPSIKHILAFNGVLCSDKQYGLIGAYLVSSINEQMGQSSADNLLHQYGWDASKKKFLLGERMYNEAGFTPAPVAGQARVMAPSFHRKGSLEGWKKVINLYGRPGLEDHAFAMLTAFGAPLMSFLGYAGGLINVMHPRSGTGKTTILRACMSVYGHPFDLCSQEKDTFVSKMLKLGALCNLPFCMDELSNQTPQVTSDMLYAITQGKGKDRMKSGSNELRENHSTWQTIGLSSSNSSLYDKVNLLKAMPEGESMRLFEYAVGHNAVLDPHEAKRAFDFDLMNNYGHAGPIYIKYLIAHSEDIVLELHKMLDKIDTELEVLPRERYWAGMMACNIVGGKIASRLGLIAFDMGAIYARAGYHFTRLRLQIDNNETRPEAVLGEFLNEHNRNVLVIKDALDARTQMPHAPIKTPFGELLVRMEPDTQKIYITASAFRKYCVERSISYKDLVADLTKTGVCMGLVTKRMGKGTEVNSPPVSALCLDTANHAYLQIQTDDTNT